MGALMRARDWPATALGDIAGWPQSLRTSVSICLNSRFPLLIWWGPDLVKIYNDAYRQILGDKHPASLGQRGRECWPEIWPIIGPMLQEVVARGEATWSEDQMLPLLRHGFSEECYFTFSYSPIRDEGGVAGVFTAVFETTARVIGERRLAILRTLAAGAADTSSPARACDAATRALVGADVPFAATFLLDARSRRVRLQCASAAPASGIEPSRLEEAFAGEIPLETWPFADPASTGRPFRLGDISEAGSAALEKAFPGVSPRALAIPLTRPGLPEPHGFLLAGLSPALSFDDSYRSFLQLASDQIVAAIGNALAYQEERERAEALAELDRAKTTFFSNVSHEFRTPLTLILGPIEDALAAGGALDGGTLEIVHRNALRLLKLVNSLLDFTRIEAGRASASFEPMDLARYTSELASVFRSTLERAGLTFSIDCPPAGEEAFVDREMWEKIVLNLLSNAFKFTLEGGIALSLAVRGDRFVLRVADTGIGIAPREIPGLFRRFHRIEGARSRSYEGSGIGLALVRELVAMHGGSIGVESVEGKGSVFTVEIPTGSSHLSADRIVPRHSQAPSPGLAESYAAEAGRWIADVSPSSPTSVARRGSVPRILLVDDNADMRDYLERLLGECYAVETAGNGVAALAAIEAAPPDLVLTDVMMPGLSGIDMLRQLRARPATRTLPVILLSARAGEVPRIEGLGSGADDYLVKPFSARELLARVAALLELRRLRGETEALLRDAGRRKDEFLAMLAHELRNPLGAISNAVELMERSGERHPDLVWARRVIDRQARHLTEIVDDLLDLSRITEGKIVLRKERLAVAGAMALAIETTRPLIGSRHQELSVEFPAGDLVVEADANRLSQVLANLLNNASKYTPEGGKISLSAFREEGAAVIRVRDTGIGIEAELLPVIFDLFVQADRTLDRSQGGLGIGLTLVRRLVELHDGRVIARSEGAGMGSEFVVSLPLAPGGSDLPVPPASAGTGQPPPRRILIVEDNADSARGLEALLVLDGHTVRVERDGTSALAAADDFQPEVVLLDIGLPGMDGYEIARALRRNPRLAGTMLVAVTGYGQQEDRMRSRAAGFDDHLVKPLRPEAIARLLRR